MAKPKPDPALQSAIRHHQAGNWAKAESIYRQVLARQPSQPDALHRLGILAARSGRMDEAEGLMKRAIEARPSFPDALANLGNVLIAREDFPGAAETLERSLALHPKNPTVLSNASFALRLTGRPEEAVERARQSLALAPDRPDALNNLGSALEEVGQFEEANDCFRRALNRAPNDAAIHLNLAHGLLRLGDPQGWTEYEWRWKNPSFKDAKRSFPEPRWDGSNLGGRSIFLYAEQGMGDTIQFLRYVPIVAERGGRVILEVQPPLKRLAESVNGVDQLTAGDGPRPHGEVRCPLMSLPLMLKLTSEQDIPNSVPYLSSDPGLRSAQTPASRRRVGLLTSGNPKFKRNPERSVPVSALGPLKEFAVEFHSLQKREAGAPPLDFPFPIIDTTDQLTDFADTAALIDSLDPVITVDSAVAHLAGAMGKPTWLLLSLLRDWRWPLEGETSIWYPSMRIFRLEKRGEWTDVIARVAAAIAQSG